MKLIKARTVAEGIEHHQKNPVRVYAHDAIQGSRIEKAQRMLAFALADLGYVKQGRTIVELGCGALDISGPLSPFHEVIGVDCNKHNVVKALERYPQAVVMWGPLEDVEPFACDILVLCEILEHLTDPIAVAGKWLKKAKAAVISHPLNEPLDSPLSGGDHSWSFTEGDFAEWFGRAGMKLRDSESFQMGQYTIGVGRGSR